jgi:SAM-dependent methyltransferase
VKLIDIPTRETLAFVREALGDSRRRVLEVGCGSGELALALANLGHEVIALDADEGAVRAARALGIDVRRAAWPDFEDRPCDAILFTRSLHHLQPLAGALDRARALVRSGGLVLVEDFAFSETSARTVAWFVDLLRVLQRGELWRPSAGSFAAKLLAAGSVPDAWHHEHEHELHGAADLRAGLEARFSLAHAGQAPYLYRYLLPVLADGEAGCELLARMLADEKAMIERGAIDAVGRRFVARRP